MSWASLKDFLGMSSHPRSITWILVSVGGLVVFLIFASWVLISFPVGTKVQGYLYVVGVDSTGKLDMSISPISNAIIDVHLNETLGPVDNNASSDLQSPTVSIGRSGDNNTEHTIPNQIHKYHSENLLPKNFLKSRRWVTWKLLI